MEGASHWVRTAAEVLHEPDPVRARELLSGALLETGHAYVVVRSGSLPDVSVYPARAWPDPCLWEVAVDEVGNHHPLYAFHQQSGYPLPATLEGVMRRGWALSDFGAAIINALGFTRHQLTIPLDPASPAGESYGLASEDPYTDQDLERATSIQPLVSGLDRHIVALDAATRTAKAAPSPDAVSLTPRELVILEHIARGSTADGIAARLLISRRTVHKHQENLYRKLGAVDRLSAVLSAQRLGLVPVP